MKLRLTEQAQQDIERIEAFWARKREKNPNLFREEIDAALTQIETAPKLAPLYEQDGYAYHKVVLPSSRHWMLYEYHEEANLAVIMTVWSPSRGDKPELPKRTP